MSIKKLQKGQVLDLFNACIVNAAALLETANTNLANEKSLHISLGLAELALEELGKSYTCLSSFCLAETEYDWIDFWKDWKNHKVKASRAFFYEFFCLVRVEIKTHPTRFPSLRNSLPEEKEFSFYVNVDFSDGNPVLPWDTISTKEVLSRVGSVFGPLNAAMEVSKMLSENDNDSYRTAVSHYALQTLTSEMFLEDVKTVLNQLKRQEPAYDRALDDIWELYSSKNFCWIENGANPKCLSE